MTRQIRSGHRCAALITSVCAVLVTASLLTGCTQRQDPHDYKASLQRTLTVRDDVVQQLDAHQFTTAQSYQAAQKHVQSVLDALDSQPPPKDYAKAHYQLVDSLDGLAVLLGKLGRCEALKQTSLQDGRACRQSIGQDVFDSLRNDFAEFDAIYRQDGLSLPQLSGADHGNGQSGSDAGSGGDVLN